MNPLHHPFPSHRLGTRRARRYAHYGACLMVGALLLAGPVRAMDVNQASADELQGLNGLGPKTAALIVKERNRAGAFESLENLAERVKGIGAKKLRRLESAGLRVGGPPPPSAAAKSAVVTPAVTAIPPGARRPIRSPASRPGGL